MVELAAAAPYLIALSAASTGYGVYAGEEQAQAGRRAKRDQDKAQTAAENAAASGARRAEEDERRARQRSPDLTGLLERERKRPGPGGIQIDQLLLGTSGVLGF